MDIRDRILDAARRVYAQHGFRGATTRLIAVEAGVNEVTLFRTFGSKESLIGELMRLVSHSQTIPQLPERPVDPQAELTAWCAAVLAQMHAMRGILRKAVAEMEDRPTTAMAACEGPQCAGDMLATYAQRLVDAGLAEPMDDFMTPVVMLMGVLWSDVMSREVFGEKHPPIAEAPALYVRTFLRAMGAAVAPAASNAPSPKTSRRAPAGKANGRRGQAGHRSSAS